MTRFLSLTILLFAPLVSTAAEKPNVLFLAVDDLNDWVACLGKRPDVKTPNIDRLAARGVLFTKAYCPGTACNPSRAAILSGLKPSTTGVYDNAQPWRPVMKDAVTLPQHFMAAGYTVEGGGKIFHNAYNDLPSWQVWHKEKGNPEPANKPEAGANGLNSGHFDWGPVDCKDEEMGDYKTASWGIEVLKRKHEKPFFLAVGMIRPHLPFFAPRKYFDMYPLDKIEVPKTLPTDLDDLPAYAKNQVAKPNGDHRKVVDANQWKQAVQAYLACITFMDTQIGRVLDALDASPYAKNTMIVLWSDHGWHLGEKQHWRKFALWEEATRVTFAVVAPGVTAEKQRCDRTVNLLDIYPTLVSLCGLPKKADNEGHDLTPLLKDPKAAWAHPSLTTHHRNDHALRSERYRYIRYNDGTEELYDHDADPLEWRNLAADPAHAAAKEELKKHLPAVNAPDAPRAKEGAAPKKNKK